MAKESEDGLKSVKVGKKNWLALHSIKDNQGLKNIDEVITKLLAVFKSKNG